ncbi:hypothetical protein [Parvibaculum sp.]|uniref:hypothetical protein n=1 Tax=Parvibaculum sp. TaxID=2024848 RepID=UPI00391CAC0F
MYPSLFLAQLIGPTLLVIGLGMIVSRDAYRTMAQEFLGSRALIYIAGILAFVPGLAIVLTHSVWVAGWPVIITLFGWLALLGGIFRLIFPQEVTRIGSRIIAMPSALTVGGVVVLALGAVLSFFGYLA